MKEKNIKKPQPITKLDEKQKPIADSEVGDKSADVSLKIFDLMPVGVTVLDMKGVILYCNDALYNSIGYTKGEFTGKHFTKTSSLRLQDIPKYTRLLSSIVRGKMPELLEATYKRKDKTIGWCEIAVNRIKIEGKQRILVIQRDITERKRAEDVLRESESKFSAIIEASSVPYALNDEQQNIVYLNTAFVKTFGYDLEDIPTLADWWTKAYPEAKYREWVSTIWQEHLGKAKQARTMFETIEVNIRCKDGTQRTVLASAAPLGETFKGVHLVILYDITERKNAEKALQESEDNFRTLIENTITGVFVFQEGKIVFVNQNFARISGYSTQEIIGKLTPRDLIHPDDLPRAMQTLQARLAGQRGESNNIYKGVRKDGSISYCEIYGVGISYGGKPAVMGTLIDITERTQIEEQLKNSEVRYRRLFEAAKDGILILDAETGTIIDVNPYLVEMMGLKEDQFLGKQLWELGFFKDIVANKENLLELQQKQYIRYEDLPLQTTDGRRLDVEFVSNVYEVDHTSVIQCNIRDITSRKQAEELFQTVSNYSPVGVYIVSDRKFQFVSPQFEKSTGYRKDQLLGTYPLDMVLPEDRDLVRENAVKMLKGQRSAPYEYRLVNARGETNWILETLASINYQGKRATLGNYMDVTERKQAEQALKESQARFKELADLLPVTVFEIDTQLKYTYLNKEVLREYHLPESALQTVMGYDMSVAFIRADRERVVHNIRRILNGEDIGPQEYTAARGDGTTFPVTTHATPIILNNAIVGLRGVSVDTTTIKQAELKIKQTNELLQAIYNNTSDSMMVIDTQSYKIISANETFLKQHGMKEEQVLGKTCYEITHEYTTPCAPPDDICPLQATLLNGQAATAVHKHFISDTEHRFMEVSTSPIRDAGGNIVQVIHVSRDITERLRAEEEHQKTARFESIGTLAGGIAHDFNNILTGILGNIQLAHGYLKENRTDTAQEMLTEAERASFRARDLTQQLLTFSRGGAPVKQVLSVNQLIRDSATFALRGSKTKPEFAIPENLWAVEADKGQLNQVIRNLVLNADQAMPNGGTISISARNVASSQQISPPLPEGNYIEITVKDQGIGIPQAYQDKIFDPYFTTKQKRSGLGLATSLSIIKNHGGTITFESQVGVGTTFHVYLLAITEVIKQENPKAEITTQSKPVATGKILVMDDEAMILLLLSRMLKGVGYEVVPTKNGTEALREYTQAMQSGKPFNAVILDLTIPGGMGGKETITKLLEIDPGVKAIVSSGYANDPILAEYKQHGFSGVVNKPYDLKQMQETLVRVLAGK